MSTIYREDPKATILYHIKRGPIVLKLETFLQNFQDVPALEREVQAEVRLTKVLGESEKICLEILHTK